LRSQSDLGQQLAAIFDHPMTILDYTYVVAACTCVVFLLAVFGQKHLDYVRSAVAMQTRYELLAELLGEHMQDFHGIETIDTSKLTSYSFMHSFVVQSRPALIKGEVSKWRAGTRWADEITLASRVKEVEVRVESIPVGATVFDPEFMRSGVGRLQTMRLDQFLQSYRSNESVHNRRLSETQLPEVLKADIREPAWARSLIKKDGMPAIWIGSPGQVTAAHRDAYENLFCVVQGAKRIFLAPPWEHPKVYAEPRRRHWSSVKEETQTAERYPLYREVLWHSVVVREGEMLFIPAHWYHKVETLEFTKVVNFWYDVGNPLLTRALFWAFCEQPGSPGNLDPLCEDHFDNAPVEFNQQHHQVATLELDQLCPKLAISDMGSQQHTEKLFEHMGEYQCLGNQSLHGRLLFRNNENRYFFLFWMPRPGRWVIGKKPGVDDVSMVVESDAVQPTDITGDWKVWDGSGWAIAPAVKVGSCVAE